MSLGQWLRAALDFAQISQAELARQLSSALRRSINRTAVNTMLTGYRKIYGDELLEISRICKFPLPVNDTASEFSRAMTAIETLSALPSLKTSYIKDDDEIQISLGDLRIRFFEMLVENAVLSDPEANRLAGRLVNSLKAEVTDSIVFKPRFRK